MGKSGREAFDELRYWGHDPQLNPLDALPVIASSGHTLFAYRRANHLRGRDDHGAAPGAAA
jgi:hypothetical protein